MKNFFLTLDLEEWYHLDYLKNYPSPKEARCVPYLEPFFAFLKASNIKITTFVLGELAESFQALVKSISDQGHEIACHGYTHELLYNISLPMFKEEVQKAKHILENITGKPVLGYRASCFSMDRQKLDILQDIGFKYDSSFINFSHHPLYSDLDLSGYEKVDDHIYRHNGFFEFEIPTYVFRKHHIPISGGGYFRLLPYPLYIRLFKKHARTSNNFVFYIHPFELVKNKIDLKGVAFKDRFRFNVGRKNNFQRLKQFLAYLQRSNYRLLALEDMLKVHAGA